MHAYTDSVVGCQVTTTVELWQYSPQECVFFKTAMFTFLCCWILIILFASLPLFLPLPSLIPLLPDIYKIEKLRVGLGMRLSTPHHSFPLSSFPFPHPPFLSLAPSHPPFLPPSFPPTPSLPPSLLSLSSICLYHTTFLKHYTYKQVTHSYCGTVEYMAPEIIKGGEGGHDMAVDWWSLGVLLFELLTCESPFAPSGEDNSQKEVSKLVSCMMMQNWRKWVSYTVGVYYGMCNIS